MTISVKVPPELKEKIKKLGIKPSKLMRKAIEEEVRRREVERIKEEIEMMRPILSKISIEEIVKSIKEDRERR
ncbi:MAG: type II toxin-antitoxin system CcdA family antitoxin [Nitrososphaerales archaeon]